jgi:hypothetical protein
MSGLNKLSFVWYTWRIDFANGRFAGLPNKRLFVWSTIKEKYMWLSLAIDPKIA